MLWRGGRSLLLTTAAFGAMSVSGMAAADPIKLAVIGPMTGDNAVYGVALQRGVELAVKQINAEGGVNGDEMVLDFLDTQCQATQAASAASRIASDPDVFAVIGDVCSSATLAALPIFYRAGLTEVSGSSTSPKITDVVQDSGYTNFARVIPSDAQQAVQLVNLAKVLNKKRVAILYASDDFGQQLFQYQQDAMPGSGLELVASETYTPAQTKNFTPQLTNIAGADPDVLLIDGYYNDAAAAVGQLSRVGLGDLAIIASAGVDQGDYMTLGGDATEGSYVFSYYNASNPSEANQAWVNAFQEAYGEMPNEQASYGYEIPFIYKLAIEQGATKDDLAEIVRGVTFEGPTGTTRFDENGDVVGKAGVVMQVKDGAFVVDPELTKSLSQ
ncbi:ABC transporter substrate-binding protein [Marinivivus vitaminiproducens]|uniref:ABC transporter substrate-binding protein n=1 Tax=Marinivivus vitaminiproducens TaxID=3035935 RepID=UPI0027A0C15B|nr:ABC transporter substrate-binding protein [Geminicoccaceae bacterium SCSIO 64248]